MGNAVSDRPIKTSRGRRVALRDLPYIQLLVNASLGLSICTPEYR